MITLPNYTRDELQNMDSPRKESFIVKDGLYSFKAIEFNDKISNAGNPMIELILAFDGPGFEFKVWEFFMHDQMKDTKHVMHSAVMKRISDYLDATGIQWSSDAFSQGKIVGSRGKAFVHTVTQKGDKEPRKRIKYFESRISPQPAPASVKHETPIPDDPITF